MKTYTAAEICWAIIECTSVDSDTTIEPAGDDWEVAAGEFDIALVYHEGEPDEKRQHFTILVSHNDEVTP